MALTQNDNELLDKIGGFVEDAVETARVTGFTDPKGGLNHGHSPDKHRVEQIVGQRIENIEGRLENNPNSHEAVHELYFRADEFNLTDTQKDELRDLRVNDKAPIPPEVNVELEKEYGGH